MENDIVVLNVVAVKDVPVLDGDALGQAGHVTVSILKSLTGTTPSWHADHKGRYVLAGSNMVFPAFTVDEQPSVARGETLVAVGLRDGHSTTSCFRSDTFGKQTDLAKTLDVIARLRSSEASNKEKVEAMFHPDRLVCRYAMKQILSWKEPPRSEDLERRLTELRDLPSADGKVMLLASRVLSRLSQLPALNEPEYVWLTHRIAQTKNLDDVSLRVLLHRLLEYAEHRPEIIRTLIGMARDDNVPESFRRYICDALGDDRLSMYDRQDKLSDAIVATFIDMLEAPQSNIRVHMSFELYRAAYYVSGSTCPVTTKRVVLERIAAALGRAADRENDFDTRHQIGRRLDETVKRAIIVDKEASQAREDSLKDSK